MHLVRQLLDLLRDGHRRPAVRDGQPVVQARRLRRLRHVRTSAPAASSRSRPSPIASGAVRPSGSTQSRAATARRTARWASTSASTPWPTSPSSAPPASAATCARTSARAGCSSWRTSRVASRAGRRSGSARWICDSARPPVLGPASDARGRQTVPENQPKLRGLEPGAGQGRSRAVSRAQPGRLTRGSASRFRSPAGNPPTLSFSRRGSDTIPKRDGAPCG